MSRASKRPAPPRERPRRALRVLVLAALATAAVLGGVWFFGGGASRRLYEEAREIHESEPARAAVLLEESVAAAGGDYPEAQLLWTRVLGRLGRWDEALGCFSLIEEPSQLGAEELVALARDADRAGVPLLAVMSLEAAMQSGNREAEVLRLLVPLRYRAGREDDALRLARRLQQLEPEDPFGWRVAANILQERRETRAAIDAYREALRRGPDAREAALIRGELLGLLIDEGEIAAAREILNELLESETLSARNRVRQAWLLRLEGDQAAALETVSEVLREQPSSAEALLVRGTLWLDAGDLDRAEEDLSRLVELSPYNKEAHHKLGQVYLRSRRLDDARRHLEESRRLVELTLAILPLRERIQREPENNELRQRLASLYTAAGQPQEAARWRASSDPD
ncbi:MAG: tetratricopeptide repeat protein [Planctomycetes bacterium]|nr:tetratricopeptide repeat protein [Planctomycetota bacterium]